MKTKKYLFFLLFFLVLSPVLTLAQEKKVEMYFFWGEGCPYCAKAKPFLEILKKEFPELEVKSYEIYNNKNNYNLWQNLVKAYGAESRINGVPSFFIGENAFAGYHESANNKIRQMIQECIKSRCPSPLKKLEASKSFDYDQNNKTDNQDSDYLKTVLIIVGAIGAAVLSYYFIKKNNLGNK